MAQTDALKKYLDAGMAFTNLTRAKAEQVVKDLVAGGELQRSQAKGAIDELLERSRKNADALSEQVRKEVDSQLASLGLARKADVERLEAELAKLKGSPGAATDDDPAPAPPKKAPAKKGPAAPVAERGSEGGKPPSKAAPAKQAAPAAPAKEARKVTPAAQRTPVSGELPAKKAASNVSEAPARQAASAPPETTPTSGELPAKKAAAGGGKAAKASKDSAAAPKPSADKAMPAKKAAKKKG